MLINGPELGERAGGCSKVGATERSGVELLDVYSRAVTTVADAISPAVVSISIGKLQPRRGPEQNGVGSGVVVAPDGYILTNSQCRRNAKRRSAFVESQHIKEGL
jgi:S1-C subfamily serine protease